MRRGALALAFVAALAGCSSEPAFIREGQKETLIESIRVALLESVEAEKSAVLATTDEESTRSAGESRALSARIDTLRGQLQALVAQDGRPAETSSLEAFDAAWKELRAVDERLLALAVVNSNLKAARLSAEEGLATLDRFVASIADLQRSTEDPDAIRALGGASVAALREQALLLIHIPTADDAKMTQLEQQMAALAAVVDRTLADARAGGVLSAQQLAAAAAAWAEHRAIAAEVVRLSRENADVRSYEVSAHEKRSVTRACLEALDELQAAVDSAPQPAR